MKFSYTVLEGGIFPLRVTYLNKVYNWFEERLEIQAIADDITKAFSSVQYIMTEANFGWLIRSVHRWSASMMVLMMILHVFRVCWFGCINSIFGVTGYSLPRDQIGYWAVKIVTAYLKLFLGISGPL
ncbi:hypothetical protein LUZ60_018416 [Juncus effusus]|nr:hypothetical protein LUZ60_018416 [Juncus effusus]